MRRWSFGVSVLLFLLAELHAQRIASNPFDIEARLATSVPKSISPSATTYPIGANPFNIVSRKRPKETAPSAVSQPIKPTRTALPRRNFGPPLTENQIFWFLMVLLGFLAFAVASKRSIVVKVWRAFLSDNALNLALREASGFVGNRPYYLLYANFLLNASLFVFLIAKHFNEKAFNRAGFLAICLVGAPLLFIAKHFLLHLIGKIFPLQAEMRRYNFLIMLFNCVLGLFLVPFNFLLASQRPYSSFLVFWLLALAGIFYLYRYMRASAIASKFLPRHLFHFLLYLCSVEIAPVLVLVKLIMSSS
ncbi:MAG: DUF4271 domain-containing protein [Saprospiraceae bacterium]|nr:DUF4271 domain-containing protein [Saprospiraceae bacterium]MDW8484408.1 DUF4271 domain-containing protein [Saprospiraceae bacterium]